MIVLLCADEADAARFRALTATEQAVLPMPGRDVPAGVRDGARVLRTNRWVHDEQAVAALQRLATRIELVDPTGLLGPVLHSPGARSRDPGQTPPVGSSMTAARNDLKTRTERGLER